MSAFDQPAAQAVSVVDADDIQPALTLAAAAKKSPSVTPTAVAIFSIELMDGETCRFSTCEMKLGEKSVCLASVRSEIPALT